MGRIEREVLRLLREKQDPYERFPLALAADVYKVEPNKDGDRIVTDAQYSTVRRALISLKRKGLAESSGSRLYRGLFAGGQPWVARPGA
jgi:DNA-binding transcriptional ArsR family regulator